MDVTALTALITAALAIWRAYHDIATLQRIKTYHELAEAATTPAQREVWDALAHRATSLQAARHANDFYTAPLLSLATLRGFLAIASLVTVPGGVVLSILSADDSDWWLPAGVLPLCLWLALPSTIGKAKTKGRLASQTRVNAAFMEHSTELEGATKTPVPAERDGGQDTEPPA